MNVAFVLSHPRSIHERLRNGFSRCTAIRRSRITTRSKLLFERSITIFRVNGRISHHIGGTVKYFKLFETRLKGLELLHFRLLHNLRRVEGRVRQSVNGSYARLVECPSSQHLQRIQHERLNYSKRRRRRRRRRQSNRTESSERIRCSGGLVAPSVRRHHCRFFYEFRHTCFKQQRFVNCAIIASFSKFSKTTIRFCQLYYCATTYPCRTRYTRNSYRLILPSFFFFFFFFEKQLSQSIATKHSCCHPHISFAKLA